MLEVNGFTFGNDELSAACYELVGDFDDAKMVTLFDKIRDEFGEEYRKGLDLMAREGARKINISHITDCVSEDDAERFFEFVKQQC